eukprot:TRINITY_DN42724_c0_g1_i1.p1 TRINITY_DN42724_c0_g1~~TRINITY_DN42724_c0_g1_i1.p1  ORF type:complete len:407 (+),score=101.22 TRINITY_DN42724_c0_g1_i1:43-1221(+)
MEAVETVKSRTRNGFRKLQQEVLADLAALTQKVEQASGKRSEDREWLMSVATSLAELVPRKHEGLENQTCPECCMVLEAGVECVCCSVPPPPAMDEELQAAAAYGQQMREIFALETDSLIKNSQTGLQQVQYALQLSKSSAESLLEQLRRTASPEAFLEAAQTAGNQSRWQKQHAKHAETRSRLLHQAGSALEFMEKLLKLRLTAPEHLGSKSSEILEGCKRTLAVHEEFLNEAGQCQKTLQEELKACDSKIQNELRQFFEPVVEDLRRRLLAMDKFLQVSDLQVQRESANGEKFYKDKLSELDKDLARLHDSGIADENNVDYAELLSKKRRFQGELDAISLKRSLLVARVTQSSKLCSHLDEIRSAWDERPAKRSRISIGLWPFRGFKGGA